MALPLLSWLKRPGTPSPARDIKETVRTRLSVEKLEDRANPAVGVLDLGAANPYNAFIFGDFTATYSDVQGRLAVGGDADITGYGIGDQLGQTGGATLVVGGDLNLSNGQVNFGDIAVGGTANIAQNVGIPQGQVTNNVPVDFAAAQADLTQKSQDFAGLAVNGSVQNNWGTLTLTGTSGGLNVFKISAAQLASATGVSINAPVGSTVLINVSGFSASMGNFAIWLNGVDKSDVLFNFYEATSLQMSAIGLPGSILAPKANVIFNNGQINGSLIAKSFFGNGQINVPEVPPPPPCPPPPPPCPPPPPPCPPPPPPCPPPPPPCPPPPPVCEPPPPPCPPPPPPPCPPPPPVCEPPPPACPPKPPVCEPPPVCAPKPPKHKPCHVVGKVCDNDDKPVRCDVIIGGCDDRGSVNRCVEVNHKGVFAFPGLRPGKYSISVCVPDDCKVKDVKVKKHDCDVSGDCVTGIHLKQGEKLTGISFKLQKKC